MKYREEVINNVVVTASSFTGNAVTEMHMVARTCSRMPLAQEIKELCAALSLHFASSGIPGNAVAFARFFVSDFMNQRSALKVAGDQFRAAFGPAAVSVVQQPPLTAGNKVVLWVYAVVDADKGGAVTPFPGGGMLRRPGCTHLWNTQIVAKNTDEDAYAQTTAVFRHWTGLLKQQGGTLADNAMRSWLFVKDIDYNYHDVVRARKDFFAAHGMTKDSHFIASTGIEGRSHDPQVRVLLDGYALLGHQDRQVRHLKALSHLNPTYEYGVTFERGTSIDFGDRRHVLISGTASIDARGEILHPMNVGRQMERAMENISALLADAEAGLGDIAQMIVYLRDLADRELIQDYCTEKLPQVPKVLVLAPVCRPGWLVEVECIAIRSKDNPALAPF